jgi:hypothetical protein
MFVIPTLTTIDSVSEPHGASLAADPDLRPCMTQPAITNLNRTALSRCKSLPMSLKLEYAQEAVRQLAQAGVPILAGSDAPNPGTWFGASLHREIELLVESGLNRNRRWRRHRFRRVYFISTIGGELRPDSGSDSGRRRSYTRRRAEGHLESALELGCYQRTS